MKTEDFLRHELSRREFLGYSARNAAGVAVGVVGLGAGLEAATKATASERVRLGVIGVRNRGRVLAEGFARLAAADVVAVCDVDADVLSAACDGVEQAQGRPPRPLRDFRRMLDDPSIDAVAIATPDHWHAQMAVLACQAGKDVYVEAPVSHTIREGDEMLAAAQRHERVVQTGLQQRSGEHFRSAVEIVRSGRLGDVRLARAWTVHRRKSVAVSQAGRTPPAIDYDLWLGPAAARSFDPGRFHYNWRWFWEYGSGELGNWGVHMLDVARWGLGVEWPVRVASAGGGYVYRDQETPDAQIVSYVFDSGTSKRDAIRGSGDGPTIVWEHRLWSQHAPDGRSAGAAFYGQRGTLIVDRGGWKIYDADEPLAGSGSSRLEPHLVDFVEAVKTRGRPAADLPTGLASSGLAHLGNISHRLRREVVFDPAAMDFGADADANALLEPPVRRAWDQRS
ncbi:MAG: Gfo/Idh/MocA family oxidoreductase [Planctomycetes bacterium]|nr:Gfo/Idh/MocA family oxidoreductase [Planctomycetota bacterium]